MAGGGPWEDYRGAGKSATAKADDGPWSDYGGSTGQDKGDGDSYGFLKQAGRATVNALPAIGGMVGGLIGTPADVISGPMGTVAGAGVGGYLGTAAKNFINSYIDPSRAPKTNTEAIVQPITGGLAQATLQGAGQIAAPYLAKAASTFAGPAENSLAKIAEEKAIESTGATGAQVFNKFQEGSGKELLKNGVVKFGRSQAKIAEKATEAMAKSGKTVGDTIAALDSRGAAVDQADIIANLRRRAMELGEDPSQFGVADSLNRLADRIQGVIEAKGGNSTIPLAVAENTKRGFQAQSNYINSHPMDLSVSKEAASIYRQAVEDAATKFDPNAGRVFQEAKSTYSVMAPIAEAAERRAATTAQSPKGGMMDTVATGVGAALGGPTGAVIAAPARRIISSRSASSMASAANAGSKIAGAIPGLIQNATPAVANLGSLGLLNQSSEEEQPAEPGLLRQPLLGSGAPERAPAKKGK